MRALLAVALVLLCGPASALDLINRPLTPLAFSPGSPREAANSAACPVGSPSPDGSKIYPAAAGHTSCVLTDVNGLQLEYQGSTVFYNQGSGWIALGMRTTVQINSGGRSFIGTYCASSTRPPRPYPTGMFWWQNNSGGTEVVPWINPTTPLPDEFYLTHGTTATHYQTLPAAIAAATSGNSLEVKPTPTGLPLYRMPAQVKLTKITINFDHGAVGGCLPIYGNAFLQSDYGAAAGLTINGSEIAYIHDYSGGGYRGVNFGGAPRVTLNDAYLHDNDMGLLSSGASSSVTLNNDLFIHNGSLGNNDPTPGEKHNLYLSCNNGRGGYGSAYFTGSISGTTLTVGAMNIGAITNGSALAGPGIAAGTKVLGNGRVGTYSVNINQTVPSELMVAGDSTGCTTGVGETYSISTLRSYCTLSGGYEMKLRGENGSMPITASTFAEPDPNGSWTGTDCMEFAAVDLPCGGQYIFGDGTAGHGNVFEVGPQLQVHPPYTGVIKYGEEAQGKAGANCPFPGPGYATNSITVNGAWFISDFDYATTIDAVYVPKGPNNSGDFDFTPYITCTIKNSKFVNVRLPSWCKDGGGNTFYNSNGSASADRAAAGLATYPYIPPTP